MCAYRIRRRSTVATIAIRAPSSPCCGCTHRIPASAARAPSSTSRGAALSGRGATCSISTLSGVRADLLERRREAGRDFLARLVRDQRHALGRLDGEADFDGVARAGRELRRKRAEQCGRGAHLRLLIDPRGFAPRTPLHGSASARSASARPRRSLGGGGRSRGPRSPAPRPVALSLRSLASYDSFPIR